MSTNQQSDDNARSDLRREEDSSQHYTNSNNSRQAGKTSENAEYKQIGSDRAVGQTNGWKLRAARLGGIRGQLRQLQAEHLAYVEAHGQRLEQRLQENRQHKTKVLADIAALEKELGELIDEAKSKAEQE